MRPNATGLDEHVDLAVPPPALTGLPLERLEALSEAVLGFRSLPDLERWLDADPGPSGR